MRWLMTRSARVRLRRRDIPVDDVRAALSLIRKPETLDGAEAVIRHDRLVIVTVPPVILTIARRR